MKIIWEKGDCSPERVFLSKATHAKDSADLRWSHYRIDPDSGVVTHKTCPCCSQNAGQFVWHRMEVFGFRVMDDNRILPQAQCPTCRGRYGKKQGAVLSQQAQGGRSPTRRSRRGGRSRNQLRGAAAQGRRVGARAFARAAGA